MDPMTSDSPARPALLNAQTLGVILAFLGAAFFATKGIIIKLALADGIDPVTTLTWRMIVAAPIFATVGLVSYRRQRRVAPASAPPLTRTLLLQAAGVGILNYYL